MEQEKDLPQSENDAAGNQLLEQMGMIETNPTCIQSQLCLRDALQITLSGLEIKHTLLSTQQQQQQQTMINEGSRTRMPHSRASTTVSL